MALETKATLHASLLDARRTFDRLVRRYAPGAAARRRILENPYYHHLAGSLAGILEYMAVERLYEVAAERRYDRVILDTPPTREALDFLEAPDRIVEFLDSGVVGLASRTWFDADGHLRPTAWMGPLGRGIESYLDRLVGLELLRDMAEFFRAFAPLFSGFRQRAGEVRRLLRSSRTAFHLVSAPGSERIPETLFFARKLREAGYGLSRLLVNRVHPEVADDLTGTETADRGLELIRWLGRRDRRGLDELESLVGDEGRLAWLPLLPDEPSDLTRLRSFAAIAAERVTG